MEDNCLKIKNTSQSFFGTRQTAAGNVIIVFDQGSSISDVTPIETMRKKIIVRIMND